MNIFGNQLKIHATHRNITLDLVCGFLGGVLLNWDIHHVLFFMGEVFLLFYHRSYILTTVNLWHR